MKSNKIPYEKEEWMSTGKSYKQAFKPHRQVSNFKSKFTLDDSLAWQLFEDFNKKHLAHCWTS